MCVHFLDIYDKFVFFLRNVVFRDRSQYNIEYLRAW